MRITYTVATALGCAAAGTAFFAGPASASTLSGHVIDHQAPAATPDDAVQRIGGPAVQQEGPTAQPARPQHTPASAAKKAASAPKTLSQIASPRGIRQPRGIDRDQAENARIIIGVGKAHGMSDRAIVIALMTAKQESDLYNIPYGDKDSIGLFQQRPKYAWGSKRQIMDRKFSARSFYGVNPHVKNAGLMQIKGWKRMSLNDAAQAVQRSGYPHRYAQWEGLAKALLKANRDVPPIR